MNQSVSVAVPTLNATGRIGSLLEKLKKQTVKPLEILVVDSSSEDGTAEEVKKIADVKLKIIDKKDFIHG
ncbi:MAG: glycosyltransferase, partial [Bifidobacteriaceae bacterium]|nr:glycosyltransferase [Bifidobacteriaceae bacterium]